MPVNPVQWAMQNVTLVVTGALVLILVAWAYDAYEDAEDSREALEGFAGNAKAGTGSGLNLVLVSVVSFVGWAATWFGTAGEFAQFLLGLAPQFPILSATVFTIGLGGVGLAGVVELQAVHFVGFSVLAVLIALAFRTDFSEVNLQ
jgi:hypothetical protein